MNFFGYMLGYWGYSKASSQLTLGTEMQQYGAAARNGVTGQPENISTVYTCIDRICNAVARMPLTVWAENQMGRMEMKQHRLYYLLRYQPNETQNAQQFWSTVEYHRLKFGNGLVRIHKNSLTGYVQSFEIIHPSRLEEITITAGLILNYKIKNNEGTLHETISAFDMLHFRNISEDGYIGLNILQALKRQTNINERATAHIDHFHENNGIQTTALETDIPGQLSGSAHDIIKSTREEWQKSNGGPTNSGKPIMLPAFTKIVKLSQSFADSQLIETLKYTREEIAAAFGLPLFMIDGSAEKLDIEQLTLLLRTNTIGPIAYAYVCELQSKLLTKEEILIRGIKLEFDTSVIIEMDYTKKVTTIKEQTTNMLMTPNEGAAKLGNKPIPGEFGNYHYGQAQYIPLEKFTEYNTLLKTDPTLKTNPKNTAPEP